VDKRAEGPGQQDLHNSAVVEGGILTEMDQSCTGSGKDFLRKGGDGLKMRTTKKKT